MAHRERGERRLDGRSRLNGEERWLYSPFTFFTHSNPLREVGRRPAFFSASTGETGGTNRRENRRPMDHRNQLAAERERNRQISELDPRVRADRAGGPVARRCASSSTTRVASASTAASASRFISGTSRPTTRWRSPRPASTGRSTKPAHYARFSGPGSRTPDCPADRRAQQLHRSPDRRRRGFDHPGSRGGTDRDPARSDHRSNLVPELSEVHREPRDRRCDQGP